jgi:hypothetical protein
MTDIDLDRLLGSSQADPGCDEAGELMDAYCELVSRGEPVSDRYAEFLTHMRNCTACREDMEGVLAMLRDQEGDASR